MDVKLNSVLTEQAQKTDEGMAYSKIHIILVHPKMPSNTGNIIRLCANTGASLHLLKPLGFELDDKKLRRAGLDYHEYAHLKVYDSWGELKQVLIQLHCQHIVALTTKFSHSFYGYDFSAIGNSVAKNNAYGNQTLSELNIALVFGSETDGLPENIRHDIAVFNQKGWGKEGNAVSNNGSHSNNKPDDTVISTSSNWLRLPMLPDSRSLNLSNSVAICFYEVWRQLNFIGDEGTSIGYNIPNKPPNS